MGMTGNKVNRQAIGSRGGIPTIKAGTVLFGGSDTPLSASPEGAQPGRPARPAATRQDLMDR